MNRYRGNKLIRSGFIGVTLVVLVIAIGLRPEHVTSWASAIRYQAVFSEAGGLAAGNAVKIAGVTVGSVTDVSLQRGEALVTFTVRSSVSLGSETTAHIRTGTLLGQRVLTLESSGDDSMSSMQRIPVTRTSSPYSLSEAVGDLTTNVAGTDTESLNHSLDVLSETLDQIAPQLGPTFEGLTRLSRSLNSRDQTVAELLAHTSDVTSILAERSDQVNSLILNANDLTSVLVERREAIVSLLASTSLLAQLISGIIEDNEEELAPTLEKLNDIAAMLEKNRDNIGKAIPGLAKFQSGLSELVSSGPYYIGYIPNLTQGALLQPFLDYAFGFRRGVDAGQPPDNAGPRAEIPFPYNGIPERQEHAG
ncbi:MCE family protein [Mycobacterium sp. SMC-4]|uniref:MCE family protein n=1 Tax=Mycobacterium sp. SMC-4 TaxID=2857059 RepID=UPI0021B3493A|nr:MCE family protein [Mycobacterium sp. SMC-4]UXA19812.1 MCE family protein [Mycobacterium sp. SMC-4]